MRNYKFTINGNNYDIVVNSIENNQAQIELNGTPITVDLNQEVKITKTPILTRKEIVNKEGDKREKFIPVNQDAKPSAKTIKSPLPGNVVKVLVKEGDVFKTDDVIMVLESMKMENNILAERSGTIVKVHINAGQSILQDAPLFDIE